MHITHSFVVVVVIVSAGCGPSVAKGPAFAPLPAAVLICPESAVAGEPFDVDGSKSAGKLVERHLKVSPGEGDVAALVASFTVPAPGAATVSLNVVDDRGNRASASCRIPITPNGAGGDEDGGASGEGEGEGDVVGGEGEGEGDVVTPGEPVDLTGGFAMIAYDSPAFDGFVLDPAHQCAPAPSLSLVTLEQSGDGHVEMSMQLCHISLPSVRVVALGVQRSDAPDEILEALPVLHAGFDLTPATGEDFRPPLAQLGRSLVAGAVLAAADDPLPAAADDAAVSDDDNDGNPGVTIHSTLGDQFVVLRRTIRAFAGVIRSSDVVEGSFRLDGDASVLSLSLLSFVMPAGLGQDSRFKLTRADDWRGPDGALTCDDVRAHYQELLAEAPPPAAGDCPSFE